MSYAGKQDSEFCEENDYSYSRFQERATSDRLTAAAVRILRTYGNPSAIIVGSLRERA
jgi:hypothetical protein